MAFENASATTGTELRRWLGYSVRLLLRPVLLNVVVLLGCLYWLDSAWVWQSPVLPTLVRDSGLRVWALAQFLALGYLIANTWRLVTQHPQREVHAQRIPKVARDVMALLILLGAFGWGVNVVYGQPLQTMVAASGLLTLVLGFALRNLVSDVFYGIALHFDGSVMRGDWVSFMHQGREVAAQLMEFDWRCAVLRDRYSNGVLIPNGEFGRLILTNLSRPHPTRQSTASIAIAVQHDQHKVVEILMNAAQYVITQGQAVAEPRPSVKLREVVKGMVLYDINVYVKPAARSSDSRHLALFAALGFLKAAGIPLKDIAYEGSIEASDVTSQLRNQQVRQRIIEQLPFFSMLAAHEHAYLAEQSQPRFFHQEQTLFNAGEEGNSMFVVLEGRLDVLAVKAQETTHIATLWPRDILGEMSLLTGAKRSATVRAVMPSVVMEICKPALSTLLRDNPLLAQGFAEQVAARELANRDRLEVATRNDATMRPSTLLSQITAFFSLSRV